MEVRHVLLADYFATDTTGKSIAAGIYSQIAVPDFPAKVPPSFLVVILESPGGEPPHLDKMAISFRKEGESQILGYFRLEPGDVSSKLTPGEDLITNVRLHVDEVELPSAGSYFFDVYLYERLERSLRLTVLESREQ